MIRIVGVGNSFRGDDAVGLLIARQLGGIALDNPDGTELLETWEGVREVHIVDAVQSGARPGTVHRMDASLTALPADLFAASTHAFGVAQAIELARVLGRLPERVMVYGIEGEDFGQGASVSQPVLSAAAALLSELRGLHITLISQ